MIRACVIGWPVSHSRSPLIHNYWLKMHGIEGSYTRQPVEPENLESFLKSLHSSGFVGCNVTLPHKENAFRIVKPADEPTSRLGAVNTLFFNHSELLGTNTDGEGFINNLRSSLPGLDLRNRRAVILGSGGAAAAIANVLQLSGMSEILVCNRSIEKARQLQFRFGREIIPVEWSRRGEILKGCDLLVNTTSLGMTGQSELEIDFSELPTGAIVADIVYTPLRTAFLEKASRRGNIVVEGLGMLLHQAVRGFELWFGIRPSVTTELFELVARDIAGG